MNATMTAGTTHSQDQLSTGALFTAGLTGGALAAAANLSLFFIAGVAGVSLVGEFQPGQPAAALPFVPVVMASIVPAIPAALLALLLQKFAGSRAATVFAAIAVVFALLSLGGPATVKGLGTAGVVVLSLMHVIAGAGIGGFLWRRLSAKN